MPISQALGVAALMARMVLDANSAMTTMTNGISATRPLSGRRDSSEIGKFAPSPRTMAMANQAARKPATTNGTAVLVFEEVRCAATAAMALCAAIMKTAAAKMTNAVPRSSQNGNETGSTAIILVYTTII